MSPREIPTSQPALAGCWQLTAPTFESPGSHCSEAQKYVDLAKYGVAFDPYMVLGVPV